VVITTLGTFSRLKEPVPAPPIAPALVLRMSISAGINN
jgi:hypothetical protein